MLSKKTFVLLCALLALFLAACTDEPKPTSVGDVSIVDMNHIILSYSVDSIENIINVDELNRFTSLGLNFNFDNNSEGQNYEEIERSFNQGKINAFAVSLEEFAKIYASYGKNAEIWEHTPVLVCVVNRSANSWDAKNVIGIALSEQWIDENPAKSAWFVGTLLCNSDDFISNNGSVKIGRTENFRLLGIDTGNVLKRFTDLDRLISSLPQASVRRDVLNSLTNPLVRSMPQNLIPKFSIVPANRVTAREGDDFFLSVSDDENITLFAEAEDFPLEGEVTFYWYNDENRKHLIGIGNSIPVYRDEEDDFNTTDTYVFYVEIIHTIQDIYGSVSSPKEDSWRVSVTVEKFDIVFTPGTVENEDKKDDTNIGELPSEGGSNDINMEEITVVDDDGETTIILQITAFEGDVLTPLKVEATRMGDAPDAIFSYQWYDTVNEILVVEGNEFNVDTSVVGEFDFYVLAISQNIEIRREVKVIIKNKLVEPEAPIITIRQIPEVGSRIVVGDPLIKLVAETQLDSKNGSEVHLTYKWYRDNNILSNETGKELSVLTNEAGIRLYRVEVTNEDLRAETESRIAFGSLDHLLTINQLGKSSVEVKINFTDSISKLSQDQIDEIEKFFKKEEIINAKNISRVQVINSTDRDSVIIAYDRREEVYNIVKSIIEAESNNNEKFQGISHGALGWNSTGRQGETVTIWVEIEN